MTTSTEGRAKPRRPFELYVAAVFLMMAALPLVDLGVGLAFGLGEWGPSLRQKIAGSGVSAGEVDAMVTVFRIVGAVVLLVGLGFAVLVWAAMWPRRWARASVTAMAALEVALLVSAMIVTSPDSVSVGMILLAGAGVALLYLPCAEEFALSRR